MSAVDAKNIIINVGVIDRASAPFAMIGSSAQGMGANVSMGMAKASTGMAAFNKKAGKFAQGGAAVIAVGLLLSAKAAMAFETSFAGVRKTVETSEEGFSRLAAGVREMATEIPIGVNELSRIMELGGQLGVGSGDLISFTDTIAKIGVTTTLATEDAAMGFARLDNVMQLGGESFDNMGSAIVDLGNNFAATEDEILNFALRIAPVGATVGLTVDEVLGLATAFSSVGIPAERGGTALQKTFIKISEAAKSGGTDLDTFARTAGMTSDAFAELVESDPAEAFTAFVTGLGNVEESGGNVFAVLDSVGLGNERVRQTLLAAANAGGVLTSALDLSNEAFAFNNALNEEAAKRFETTASKATIAKNKINDLAISVGNGLLPTLGNFAGGASAIVDWLQNLSAAAQSAIAALAGIVTGAGIIAAGHPVIGGLLLFAATVAQIGKNAAEAEQHIIDMKNAAKDKEGFTTGTGRDLVTEAIGEGGVRELEAIGFGIDDIDKALRGTNEDWLNFHDRALEAVGGSFLDLPEAVGRLRTFRGEVKEVGKTIADEEEHLRLSTVAYLTNQAAREEMWKNQERRYQSDASKFFYGSDRVPIEPDIIYPAYDAAAAFSEDIASALGDYVTAFNDAFDETDQRIRDQISLWYIFDEGIDLSAESLIELTANLSRQVSAIGSFEALIASQNLSPVMEKFVRDSFNTPSLMEQYVEWAKADPAAFEQTIKDWEDALNPLTQIILDIYEREYPDIEFKAGTQLLTAMKGIVQEIVDDPNTDYNVAEAWLGVIYQTLDNVDPSEFDAVYEMLVAAFGTGGVNEDLGITLKMIEEIARALGLLPTNTDVTVTFKTIGTPPGLPGDADNFKYPDASIGVVPERKALGGNVFGRTPYLVGELGPELFIPSRSGTIVPNNKLKDVSGPTYNLTINGSTRPDQDAQTALLAASLIGGM